MKHLFTFLLLLAFSASAWAQKPSVLIVHSVPEFALDVQAKLTATNQLASITLFDARVATPTLEQLQAYDVVLVFSDGDGFQDQNTLGDNLAAYVNGGKGVVRAVFAFFASNNFGLGGAFDTDTYRVLNDVDDQSQDTRLTLGTVAVPSHPIMQGVTSFDGGSSSFHQPTTLTSDATLIASWSNGRPLIAVKTDVGTNQARRVDLNFFPPSSDAREDFWEAKTDGARIMANALVWASKKNPCPTLTPSLEASNNGVLTCTSPTLRLTAGGGDAGATYVFNGPAVSAAGSNSANAGAAGQYTVTVTNPGGCPAVTSAPITVTENKTPPAGVSLSSTGTLSANNPTATLTASSNATAGVGVSYEFSQPARKINDNQASVTTSGTYSVTATRADNGCSAQATTNVLGAASVTACRYASATLKLTAAGSPTRYEWYVGIATGQPLRDGSFYQGTATANLTVVRVTQSQVYYAKVFYSDGSSVVYGPFRVTLNPNCSARQAADVDSPGTELRITLLGNPLQGETLKALVQGATGQRLQVGLVDQSGRSVRSEVFESADAEQAVEWNLSGSASGLYLLQAVSGQQRQTAKLVKP